MQECSIDTLTLADVVDVARGRSSVAIPPDAREAVRAGRAIVDELAGADLPVYGISTGFGALATVSIPADRRTALQRSLIRSHAAGTGALVDPEVVRALMVLRLKTLASGLTGVRPVVVETLARMVNEGITPAVRTYGSLGCSGDLAPLSHVALVAMGEGEVLDPRGGTASAADALAQAGIEPLVLHEKEGLALINGTDGMLGMLALALADLDELFALSDLATAMSVEALLGTDRAFAEDLRGPAPASRPGRVGGQSAALAGRFADRGQPPGGHRTPGSGRLLLAVRTPGHRSGQGHRRARPDRG